MSPRFGLIVLVLAASFLSLAHGQAGRPNGEGTDPLKPLKPGDDGGPKKGPETCSKKYRTFDGRCNNPKRKEWGSTRQPLYSYVRGSSSKKPRGGDLDSPRLISNKISKQDGNVFSRRGLSEMVTFFGQFLDHTIVAASANADDPFHIDIPPEDPIFANFSGKLTFHRNIRGPVKEGRRAERPINSLTSFVDLDAVYGPDPVRTKSLRSFRRGRMETSGGNMLPINTAGLFNAPTKQSTFFLAGDHRANEHPVLTSLHTIFLREHNLLAKELRRVFPGWSEEDLFETARQINIAQFQKIVFDEFYPVLTGRKLKPYTGFKKKVNPGISDIFSTAAYRVGHTMVGNAISMRGPGNSPLPSIPFMAMFFKPVDVMKGGVEPFLRGAAYNPAQEVDLLVHDSLRNFLFTRIPQEIGFDLIAMNIQRGRDHAIPTYNEIRKIFGLRLRKSFEEISSSRIVQSKLLDAYKTVDKIEAWPGLMAEDHEAGASMGETMLAVWEAEFLRLRDGDRFFYRQWNVIPKEVFDNVPRIRSALFTKELLRSIIIRNTNIKPSEFRGSIWKSNV